MEGQVARSEGCPASEASCWRETVVGMVGRAWATAGAIPGHPLNPLIERVMALDYALGLALEDAAHSLVFDALDFGAQAGYALARTSPSAQESTGGGWEQAARLGDLDDAPGRESATRVSRGGPACPSASEKPGSAS